MNSIEVIIWDQANILHRGTQIAHPDARGFSIVSHSDITFPDLNFLSDVLSPLFGSFVFQSH